MDRDFFDPPLEDLSIVSVGAATLTLARKRVLACEACDPEAEIPFDNILDHVTGSDARMTDYVVEASITCPQCGASITEKTLVDWNHD